MYAPGGMRYMIMNIISQLLLAAKQVAYSSGWCTARLNAALSAWDMHTGSP